LRYLGRSCQSAADASRLLQFVLADCGDTAALAEAGKVRRLGVEVIEAPLVSEKSRPYLDPRRVVEHLLALA